MGKPMFAPPQNPGRKQVIPTYGAHEQIYITDEQEYALVWLSFIYYDADYGPNAKVYRPVKPCTADVVRSWLP